MISFPSLDRVTKQDILTLIDSCVSEGASIEFKSDVPWTTQSERKNLVTHISAIANAGGGTIYFGIREVDGVAVEAVGMLSSNIDELKRGIDQAVRDGTDPPIVGLRYAVVDGFENGPVLVLRIPRTWATPHMVTVDKVQRFYIRDSGSRHVMSTHELRNAFTMSDFPDRQARRFREARLRLNHNGDGPMTMADGPKLVVHVLPLSAFDRPGVGNYVNRLREPGPASLLSRSPNRRYNVEGLLQWSMSDLRGCYECMQFFRWGPVEAVVADFEKTNPDQHWLSPSSIEEAAIEYCQFALDLFRCLDIGPPYAIMLSLLGSKGYGQPQQLRLSAGHSIDQDEVIMPDIVLNEGSDSSELDIALSGAFDVLWNAFGYPERMKALDFGRFAPWRGWRAALKP
jgi:hypothetical protein